MLDLNEESKMPTKSRFGLMTPVTIAQTKDKALSGPMNEKVGLQRSDPKLDVNT